MDLMHQVTHVSKVDTVDTLAPSIFVSTVRKLLYVTLLLPPLEFLDCFLSFGKLLDRLS